jgi:hypothetical protein
MKCGGCGGYNTTKWRQKHKKIIFYILYKKPMNTSEICVFYKQPQNLTFTNKPTQPTQPIPENTTINNNTIHRMMPM